MPFSVSQEAESTVQTQNKIIINNTTAEKNQAQQVTAPALVPSSAKKLREAREKQEVTTEDTIIKELEKQRLIDEQKRVSELFGGQSQKVENSFQQPVQPPAQVSRSWFFRNKSFVSIGAGGVLYPHIKNVNSLEMPAGFISFGGYGYAGHLIFDVMASYSQHYVCRFLNDTTIVHFNPDVACSDINDSFREKIDQPAVSMAIKYSPMEGRVKPYVGIVGALVFRKVTLVNRRGEAFETHRYYDQWTKDVGKKSWNMAYDAGGTLGADIALGDRLGLNVDFRYYTNLDAEDRSEGISVKTLAERDSMTLSLNLRYYF